MGVPFISNRSVLVVDDDAALRTLFVALLTRHEFLVECVNDGAEALARLEEQSYGAVLLDLMMPVTNGFDVLQQLASTKPALLRKIIVTTGVSQRDLAKIDPSSVFAVLRKPFDINLLLSTVRECTNVVDTTDDEVKLDQSISRFESALPELKTILSSETSCDHELALRSELRRTIKALAGVISAAAHDQRSAARSNRYANVSLRASRLAMGSLSRRHDH